MKQFKRKFVGACACVTLAFAGVVAAGSYKPDALLSIDLNRNAVVEKIVSAWGNEIPAAQRESFKTKLQGLRADHLLSANLSGSFEGVLEVLSAQESAHKMSVIPATQNGTVLSNISENVLADKTKALGDAAADLVYTPITPCRLFDTRTGQASALGVAGGIFSNQQRRSIVPAGACGIPTTGVASLFLSYHAYSYNPAVLGVIGFMKPGDPFSALAGAWTGGVWVTSTYITGTSANGNFDAFVGNGSAMTADMIVDVMGYFRAPQGVIGDITEIQTAAGSGLVGGVASGVATLSLATTQRLPTTACAAGQLTKWTGAAWACASEERIIVDNSASALLYVENSNTGAGVFAIRGIGNGAGTGVLAESFGGAGIGIFGLAHGTGGTGVWGRADTPVATGIRATNTTPASGKALIADGNVGITNIGTLDFGQQTRQMIDLWGLGQYGIGVQGAAQYYRSATRFCWFRGGVHADGNGTSCDPGAGGTLAMYLQADGLNVNGTFVSSSDREVKQAFRSVDVKDVLKRVVSLPISSWVYKNDSTTRHIGPVAQDFKRLFDVGSNDKTISMVDADGVALAAIKGLHMIVKERDAKIVALEKANDTMQRELAAIKKKLGL